MIETVHAATQAAHEAVQATGPIGTFGLFADRFVAQLVNFAIVLFILWRWVYKPLLKVMDERTSKIEKSLADARAIEEERKQLEVTKAAEITRAKDEARLILEQAAQKANAIAQMLQERAKKEVEDIVVAARTGIAVERETMRADLRKETLALAAMIAQKVLAEKFTAKDDEHLLRKAFESVEQR